MLLLLLYLLPLLILNVTEWNKWAHDQIRNWGRCLQYWINIFKGPKVIIFYEDLKTNLKEQLITINEFLGLPLDKERLFCTLQSNAQKFHRKVNSLIVESFKYDKKILTLLPLF